MFTFKVHPAAISVFEGIQHAFEFLGASWRSWLPVAAVLGAVQLVFYLALGTVSQDQILVSNRYTNEVEWVPGAEGKVAQLALLAILGFVASMVAGWAITGIAIAGLRGWKLSVSVVLSRGLVMLASSLIVLAVVFCAMIPWVVVTVAAPAIGILSLFVLIPLAIYAAIRIAFSSLAIFEGFGPLGGLQESWRLSQGGVGRMFGWGLMAGLISMGFSFVAGAATAPLSVSGSGGRALGQAAAGAIGAVATVFGTFFLAVLYESQRARHDMSLYPVANYPAPVVPAWPAYPPAYPPAAYPPGAYPPAAYPPPAYPPAEGAGPADAPPGWPPQGS